MHVCRSQRKDHGKTEVVTPCVMWTRLSFKSIGVNRAHGRSSVKPLLFVASESSAFPCRNSACMNVLTIRQESPAVPQQSNTHGEQLPGHSGDSVGPLRHRAGWRSLPSVLCALLLTMCLFRQAFSVAPPAT